jgi:hypothetical protein
MYVMFTYLFVFAIVSQLSFLQRFPLCHRISRITLNPIPHCHWNHRIQSRSLKESAGSDPTSSPLICFSGPIETTESLTAVTDPMVSLKPQEPIPWSHWNCRNRSRSLIETVESELCKLLSQISLRLRSHLRNSVSPWIRALEGLFDEKNEGKNLMTLSFYPPC